MPLSPLYSSKIKMFYIKPNRCVGVVSVMAMEGSVKLQILEFLFGYYSNARQCWLLALGKDMEESQVESPLNILVSEVSYVSRPVHIRIGKCLYRL